MTEKLNLEKYKLYRLVQVMYVFFLIVGLLGVLLIGWGLTEDQLVDGRRSFITCPSGKRLSFNELKFNFDIKRDFTDREAFKSIQACNPEKIELLKSGKYTVNIPNRDFWSFNVPYSVNWECDRDWFSLFKFWLLGSLIVFIIFNLTKQAVIYILYGKKFTIGWGGRRYRDYF